MVALEYISLHEFPPQKDTSRFATLSPFSTRYRNQYEHTVLRSLKFSAVVCKKFYISPYTHNNTDGSDERGKIVVTDDRRIS